jgi:hypothetical protein
LAAVVEEVATITLPLDQAVAVAVVEFIGEQ